MNIRALSTLVHQQNQDILQQNQKVAIALSGGVDSTALFHVFLDWSKKKKYFDLTVLHVNFALRGKESEGDQRFVEALAGQFGISCEVLDASRSARLKGESVQVWARRVRHEWFEKFVKKGFKIALAHNQDDVAENVLLRLSRGSEPENLAGMSMLDGGIWRPFIRTPRSAIEAAMQGSDLCWREDSSNAEAVYARNRIRHEVIPVLETLFPGASGRIARHGESSQSIPAAASRLPKVLAGDTVTREKLFALQSFLETGTPGQSLDVGAGFKLLKAVPDNLDPELFGPRELQHLGALDGHQFGLILPSNARLRLPGEAKSALYELFASQGAHDAGVKPESREFFIRPAKPGDKVFLAERNASFKFKDLMQKWKVPARDRSQFLVAVSTDGSVRLFGPKGASPPVVTE